MVFFDSLVSARHFYADSGFDIIPLPPGKKAPPLIQDWVESDLREAWGNVPSNANIAIRCGGSSKLAVIDCDDKNSPGTYRQIVDYLEGIGLSIDFFPIVQTASGVGRHIYFELDYFINSNSGIINKEFGSGEIRVGPGAYVVAPPSQVENGNRYSLLHGDFSKLPIISINDLYPLITYPFSKQEKREKWISRKAHRLLNGDFNIPDDYPSRSEAECVLMVSLINTGHTQADILRLFNIHPCGGKFAEKGGDSTKGGRDYFDLTYKSAREWAYENVSIGRKKALEAIEWAQSTTWPGRTGSVDKSVFLAHAALAKRCGKLYYGASCRELAKIANVSHVTASKSTGRLVENKLLLIQEEAAGFFSTRYSIANKLTLPQSKDVRECKVMHEHDLFSRHGFGKSGREICELLRHHPLAFDEIVSLSGKHRTTIKRRLLEMKRIIDPRTGEIHSLVNEKDGVWRFNENCDFDVLARIIGVYGVMRRREWQYEQESRNFKNLFT